jgi:hypothetical protein
LPLLLPIEWLEIPLSLPVKIDHPEGVKALSQREDVGLSPAQIEVFANHLEVSEKYF